MKISVSTIKQHTKKHTQEKQTVKYNYLKSMVLITKNENFEDNLNAYQKFNFFLNLVHFC